MLPERFTERMKNILGAEYAAFASALEEPSVRAIRVNETKVSVERFLELTSLNLSPISYARYGFIPESCDGIGNTPEHHAGMFYVQDPGAMATVTALEVKRGWRVLDTCAAPGGKSSQLASLVGDEGFLHANEYVPKRAKIIVGNLERLGVKNAVVTSLDTAELARMYDSYFDLVLCDAPCSGEGMFRKYDEAITEWSEENVALCAKRQREILDNSAKTVKHGGYLLYSTCTYSVEENEECVADFLAHHPDFGLVEVGGALSAVSSSGLPTEGAHTELARRFYPHKSRGEGQFIALMKRDDDGENMQTPLYKSAEILPSKTEMPIIKAFLSETLGKIPSGKIIKHGEGFALIPDGISLPPKSVFMAGVMLGEIRGKNFIPHHQLFSAYGNDFIRKENLKRGDGRVAKYLHGEEIPACEVIGSGYTAVLFEGVALGGGKLSSGVIKNHYPKGLRTLNS